MALLGYESIGAEKAPILPRKSGNAEYSLQEAEKFVTGDDKVAVWWRENLLRIVNRGLTASGQNIKVDESNIHWIFENITYDFKDLGAYTNSRLSDGVPEFFADKDGWSGNVAIFRYGTCTIILYKTQCMNLLDIPVKVTTPPADIPPAVIVKKDTVYIQTVSVPQPISINIENNNTNTNTVCQPSSDVKYVMGEEEEYIQPMSRPVYYNQRPMMRQMPQVRMNFSIRGGVRRQQNYPLPPEEPVINHASGTGGFKTGNRVYNGSGTRGRRN